MQDKITVKSLLHLIDKEELESIRLDTNVDYKSKKLSGELVLKLLLMSIVDNTKVSLRIMEKVFSTPSFQLFSGAGKQGTVKYNSISERLSTINSNYFEKVFQHVFSLSKKYFKQGLEKHHIRQFDSTSLSLSTRLLKKGMVNGLKNKEGKHTKTQVKFTVGLLHQLPGTLKFYNEQHDLGEDLTLREAILDAGIGEGEIAVFDRGLKKRKTFKEFNDHNILFVTRINPTKSVRVISEYDLTDQPATQSATLRILSDQKVHLYHYAKNVFKEDFRLVKAESKITGEILFFLTNITDLPAVQITEIYKKRWDIEVFFKFIKQHLHFKHFISYNENGIKVMMYTTMIAAILILIYKKLNKIENYKMAKYDFIEELNMEIIKEIVIICGGDPGKIPRYSRN
jgi:hypothetical protein